MLTARAVAVTMSGMDYSSRRTSQPYDALAGRTQMVSVQAGESSYFTAPTATLDPSLFTPGEQMRPGVRHWILDTLHTFLVNKHFVDPLSWCVPWVAGSGASYQWSAARDPGDLDILIGVDYPIFRQKNGHYDRLSDDEVSQVLNEVMQATLWPATARQGINGSTFEVTWFVNPGATDIRSINPYAAYNVMSDGWTVRPIELPQGGSSSLFDKTWYDAADSDLASAKGITARYDAAITAYTVAQTAAAKRNALAQLTQATTEGASLFDDIHLGRKEAFSATGEGYADWHNFRWQRGKLSGTVQALHQLKTAQQEALNDTQTALYGAPLVNANAELLKALEL